MRWKTSPSRLGAIVLAAALTGSYVWFRVDQARQRREAVAAKATAVKHAGSPTTQPSDYFIYRPSSGPAVVVESPTSSFSELLRGLTYSYENPYPSTGEANAGFKLNTSVSAEFVVASDSKAGIIDLIPNRTVKSTRPASATRPTERGARP